MMLRDERRAVLARTCGLDAEEARARDEVGDGRRPTFMSLVAELEALGENPDPDAVERIMGNQLPPVPGCDFCFARQVRVLLFSAPGSDHGDESAVCLKCVTRATAVFAGDAT
jgi:hypothetical protein